MNKIALRVRVTLGNGCLLGSLPILLLQATHCQISDIKANLSTIN